MRYVNLKSIVNHVYEEEIENDPVSPQDKADGLYEKSRKYLLEIFNAVDVVPDLLKRDGEYSIPIEDGEFIEWLLREFTTPKMKLVRNGKFQEAGPEYLYRIIKGIKELLIDLGTEDIKVQAQVQIMMEKTEYELMVRMYNIKYELEMAMNNLVHYTYVPTFHLSREERCDYLDWVQGKAEQFEKEVMNEFSSRWKSAEDDLKSNALKFETSDLKDSERSLAIVKELHNNDEYQELEEQLRQLEDKKQPLIKYEKRRNKITKRMQEILNEVARQHPIDLDQASMLEKLLYFSEDGFTITHRGGEEEWYVSPRGEYKFPGTRS